MDRVKFFHFLRKASWVGEITLLATKYIIFTRFLVIIEAQIKKTDRPEILKFLGIFTFRDQRNHPIIKYINYSHGKSSTRSFRSNFEISHIFFIKLQWKTIRARGFVPFREKATFLTSSIKKG